MKRSAFVLALVATVLATLFVQGSSVLQRSHAAPASGGNPLYILPLGDSITHADHARNSYRRLLWHMLQEEGFDVDFVGSMNTNYPGEPPPNPDFDLDHESHGGWRADQIISGKDAPPSTGQGKLKDWLQGYTPDIVLMHLGSNDMFQGQSIDSTLDDLKQIIDLLRQDNPHVGVLIAQLIPAADPVRNARITALNSRIPEIATEKDLPDSMVIVVDQHGSFRACDPGDTDSNCDTYDGVHPNAQGERKIAEKWFDALSANICGAAKLIADINDANEDSRPDAIDLDARCGYILHSTNNDTDGPNGLPSITSEIIIVGNGATIARNDSASAFRVFHVAGEGRLALYQVTIRNGVSYQHGGGGIYNGGEYLTLIDSSLVGNQVWYERGGGIYNRSGRVRLIRSTLTDNTTVGLGICGSGNTGGHGGGIYNDSGTVDLSSSTVWGNNAGCGYDGGGIYNQRGWLIVTSSTVSLNGARRGGGIAGESGTVELTNATISKNQSNGEFWVGGPGCGGGIYHSTSATVRMVNSILADNSADRGGRGDCCTSVTSEGYNLDSDGTCGLLSDNHDLPNVDPKLSALEDFGGPTLTHGPFADSPAIDAGSCLRFRADQRGAPRPVDIARFPNADDGCDIGAFERQERTAIDLLSFTARPAADRVLLSWETATEVDNAGFNVWRSESEDGEYVQINETLIPAEGDAASGARYRYTDRDVTLETTYYYKLEDVNTHGVSAFHGPVSAMPGRIRRIYLPLVLR